MSHVGSVRVSIPFGLHPLSAALYQRVYPQADPMRDSLYFKTPFFPFFGTKPSNMVSPYRFSDGLQVY
jgi:hypothetical protein